MRDFRLIRQFEGDWKEAQQKISEAKQNLGQSAAAGSLSKGAGFNLEELVDELADMS